jgi:hypothetical protein
MIIWTFFLKITNIITFQHNKTFYWITLYVLSPNTIKGKAIPLQALTGPDGSRRLRFPDFKTHGTLIWEGCQPYASAVFTPRKYSWYSFLLEAESTPDHSATGRIMSIKNFNDTIWNRSRNLLVCSAVPQPLRHRVSEPNAIRVMKWKRTRWEGHVLLFLAWHAVYAYTIFVWKTE